MEIVPGIHMIDGSIGCNTYLIVDDGLTLVDTGQRGNVPRIYDYLGHIGHAPRDIRRIVITHAHIDHINCLHELKQDTGATVFANAQDAGVIEGKEPLRTGRGLLAVLMAPLNVYFRYRPVPVDVRLGDGEQVPGALSARTVYLPGHSAGNMGLYCPARKTFFSSDSIRVVNGRLAAPVPRFTADMNAAVASIRMIGELDFDVMLPGHGVAVTEDAAAKVKALYHEIRQ